MERENLSKHEGGGKSGSKGSASYSLPRRGTCTLSEKQGVRRQQVYKEGCLHSQVQDRQVLDRGSNLKHSNHK